MGVALFGGPLRRTGRCALRRTADRTWRWIRAAQPIEHVCECCGCAAQLLACGIGARCAGPMPHHARHRPQASEHILLGDVVDIRTVMLLLLSTKDQCERGYLCTLTHPLPPKAPAAVLWRADAAAPSPWCAVAIALKFLTSSSTTGKAETMPGSFA